MSVRECAAVQSSRVRAMTAEIRPSDPGLYVLISLVRLLGVNADPGQIRHRFGTAAIGVSEMLRCAKELGLKARERTINWDRLATTSLPAIAALRNGGFLLLGKFGDGKILVQSPQSLRPALMSRSELEAVWDGRVVIMARRASLTDLARHFDVTWFIGAIHKYRHQLIEVFVASFSCRYLHSLRRCFPGRDRQGSGSSRHARSMCRHWARDHLSLRDCAGHLRTYLFAHTTNHVDVELGARLFRHLLALPIAYFGARRVGDSVARVRELENIRNFLTSSALTLVIDLFFLPSYFSA